MQMVVIQVTRDLEESLVVNLVENLVVKRKDQKERVKHNKLLMESNQVEKKETSLEENLVENLEVKKVEVKMNQQGHKQMILVMKTLSLELSHSNLIWMNLLLNLNMKELLITRRRVMESGLLRISLRMVK